MSDYIGWRFIIEPKKMGRLLCLDTDFGSTALVFSKMCHQLSIIHFDPNSLRVIKQRLDGESISNVDYSQILLDNISFPFPDEYFDGFILNNLNQIYNFQVTSSVPNAFSSLQTLFTEVYRILKKDSFSYINLRNKYGYTNLARIFLKKEISNKHKYFNKLFSSRMCKQAIKNAGFDQTTVYRLLTDNDTVNEIILESNYKSTKNSSLFKEKVKQHLLSDPWGTFFAPSLGILCFKGKRLPNYLDELVDDLTRKNILIGQNKFAVKRYYILPGKVILSVGYTSKLYGEKIVVLPLNLTTLERRRHEARILEALHHKNLHISSLIPKFYLEGNLYRQVYLVQEEMPGVSIDAPVPLLNEITWRAVQVLIDFHVDTANETTLGDDLFYKLFSKPLHRIIDKLGPCATTLINSIENILREQLWEKRIKTVWLHGDFKIENVLINSKSLEVCGIIDWDLSQEEGFPLLDLLYLITYNRVIREKKAVEDIFLDTIIQKNFSEFEKHIFEAYIHLVGLEPNFIDILITMFWVYHIAYRIKIDSWPDKSVEKILYVLSIVEKKIESEYG